MDLQINESLAIPEQELTFVAVRSGGPGGQNVNKVSSKVVLRFDVDASGALSPEQKATIHRRLANRIGKDGVLQVASQKYRTQAANRRAVLERFIELLSAALSKARPRKRTSIPSSARRRRLEKKSRRAELKRSRSKVPPPP